MAKIIFGIAIVLALAALLFWSGWFSASSRGDAAAIESVQNGVAAESKAIQDKIDARLDRIEGKIDALLKIATTPPPDMQQSR